MDNTDLIGVPFKNKGRSKEEGFDCYGLVKEVYHRYGIDIPEYDVEYNFDDMCRVNELITENAKSKLWRQIPAPKVPCAIAMRFGSPDGVVNHTAVYIGNGMFIHCRERVGVCIDRLTSPAWRRCVVGFYEYVGD